MTAKECDCQSLNQVLGGLVKKLTANWAEETDKKRTTAEQFGLLWLGAFVFAYPLFILHFHESLRAGFTGHKYEEIALVTAGIVSSAVIAVLPSWLAMTENKGQTKVRLFLTGFLLPYVVVALLLPLMQTT